jgi:hypothetical protein
MELPFRFLLLLIHTALTAIGVYYIGDFISQPVNILIVLMGALIYLLAIIAFILHIKNFLFFIKKQNNNL